MKKSIPTSKIKNVPPCLTTRGHAFNMFELSVLGTLAMCVFCNRTARELGYQKFRDER